MNKKTIFAVLSPIFVIAFCGIFVLITSKVISEWVFIPAAIIYGYYSP